MNLNKILMTMAGLGALACTGSAATITFTTNVASQTTPFSTNFTISGFNTSLGTLTGVSIADTVTGTPALLVANTTVSSQNFTNGNSTTPILVTGPDGTSVSLTETATGISGTVPAGTTASFNGTPFSGSASANVSSANFSQYQSSSPITLNFTAASGAGTYSGTAANGVFFSGDATAAEGVTITYTYSSATPEPTTLALLGFGLIGCGLVGRKRLAR